MSRSASLVEPALSYGRVLVALTVLVSFAALYGLSLASDPQTYDRESELSVARPCEEDYLRVPDPSHNKRIFALRTSLEQRGYQLNGGVKVTEDPLAPIRGVYGFISPNDELHTLEWRLMATRSQQCQPSSFLRLQDEENAFSLAIGRRLLREWSEADQWMPSEMANAAERLLAELHETWQRDRAADKIDTSLAPASAAVVRREWSTCRKGHSQYRLRLTEMVGEYQLDLEVTDNLASAGRLASCDVILHFRWMQ